MKRLTRDKCLKIIQGEYDPKINYFEVSEKYLEIIENHRNQVNQTEIKTLKNGRL